MSAVMQRIALKAIELINTQAEEGVDMDGKQYAYSTKPFAMPLGAGRFRKSAKAMVKAGKINIIKRSDKDWAIIVGGYKALREERGLSSSSDFLQDSGAMLRALTVEAKDEKSAIIKFSDAAAAQKAFWLTVSGAGKSRKLWKFFGLNDKSRAELMEFAARELAASPQEMMKLIEGILQ
jgi:hypothetical protein